VLVVDAAAGGFEAGFASPSHARGGGQTREHAQVPAHSIGPYWNPSRPASPVPVCAC
jgi:hypothetical protein